MLLNLIGTLIQGKSVKHAIETHMLSTINQDHNICHWATCQVRNIPLAMVLGDAFLATNVFDHMHMKLTMGLNNVFMDIGQDNAHLAMHVFRCGRPRIICTCTWPCTPPTMRASYVLGHVCPWLHKLSTIHIFIRRFNPTINDATSGYVLSKVFRDIKQSLIDGRRQLTTLSIVTKKKGMTPSHHDGPTYSASQKQRALFEYIYRLGVNSGERTRKTLK